MGHPAEQELGCLVGGLQGHGTQQHRAVCALCNRAPGLGILTLQGQSTQRQSSVYPELGMHLVLAGSFQAKHAPCHHGQACSSLKRRSHMSGSGSLDIRRCVHLCG
jgi:hypothetical protein